METKTRVALITGANRGIGFETARELGERGIAVVLGSRDLEKGEKAASKLAEQGMAAEAIRLDVTVESHFQQAYEYLSERHGKLDILINNAGITLEDSSCLVSPQDLQTVFQTNFFGLVTLTQTLLPLIRKSSSGRIVNLSSVLGSLTMHSDPKSRIYEYKKFAYDASKTALNAFSVHLAYELRDTSIKVNSADPGWVKTDMGGEFAPMEVSEGGKTSAYLATLPEEGPTGGFFHLNTALPW